MIYLDTRDLEDRRQELEDELETLKSALTEAEEALAEADEDGRDDAEIDLNQAHRDLDEWEGDYQDEFDALNNLRDEFDHRSWRGGITLIPEDDSRTTHASLPKTSTETTSAKHRGRSIASTGNRPLTRSAWTTPAWTMKA